MTKKNEFDQLKEMIEQAHRHHENGNYRKTREILSRTTDEIEELDGRIESAQALLRLKIND